MLPVRYPTVDPIQNRPHGVDLGGACLSQEPDPVGSSARAPCRGPDGGPSLGFGSCSAGKRAAPRIQGLRNSGCNSLESLLRPVVTTPLAHFAGTPPPSPVPDFRVLPPPMPGFRVPPNVLGYGALVSGSPQPSFKVSPFLGKPLALREIPGPGRKLKIGISPC